MDINTLIYSSCHNPQKVKIYNGITNMYEYKDVPCGNCLHCKMTRINEWVTRMVIESNAHKYVYYGTLTYNGKRESIYNNECLAIRSNFNKTNQYNNTPLILRKDHLQKFFKRLRKNTGIKFQYAACGEYGSTYSRPHFHYIIWSDKPISKISVYKAWTAPASHDLNKKVIIGKVEHRDIKNNPYPNPKDPYNTHVFKYVAKYINKIDFDFEKLTNINQLKECYEREFKFISTSKGEISYLSERIDEYLVSKSIKDWNDFKKVFSPFFHCSRRPALGYNYFKEQIREYENGNFKLFGLPKEYIFPLYFIRKTKEHICPLKAESQTNSGVTSYSRLPKVVSLLENVKIAERIAEDTDQIVQLFRCTDNFHYEFESREPIQDGELIYHDNDKQEVRDSVYRFKREYLGFVNTATHVRYVFFGTHYSMYTTNGDNYIGQESIENVIQLIKYYYGNLKRKILEPLYRKSQVSANQKAAYILDEYGDEQTYKKAREQAINNLINNYKAHQNIYKQSKTFE